ncbi:MAG TPA: VWA domain-containing protein [Thermoanaerobaculia bacterium]|jgi:VWFA-related protein
MARVALLFLFCCLPAFARESWSELVARAQQEKKPIVVFFRTPDCPRCDEFQRISLPHPTIQRRLPAVLFATLPAPAGEEAHVALFDRTGAFRVRWPMIPDTTNLGIILDSITAVAPHFERAVQLAEAGKPYEGDLEAATAFARLGRISDARAALARAEANGVTLPPAAPAPAPKKKEEVELPRIRILPPQHQVVSGRQLVQTHVASGAVARVTFSLDDREVARVERPPFSATLDFGAVPERHSIRVVAFDARGKEIGRDERVVNEAGEAFWLRIVSPTAAYASGPVRVAMNLRAPAARRVRVVVSWNDAERAVLTKAPWEASVRIPEGQAGVLRAVAELDDGRTSEDAVLLNAGGAMGRADVQLVELPITVVGGEGITAERIMVQEGDKVRRVESVATAAETPLTIGMLIDVSGSMQRTLPDLQEAAIRFLETMLGERDRAFLVAFDTRARLLQPATSDVASLRRQIMTLRPDGLTALHDAIVLGLLQFEGIKGRRAMIVFSDGHDVVSRYSAADVSELARRVNVPIHVMSAPQRATAGDVVATDRELKRVSEATGGTGQTLHELVELPGLYARIEAALRAQILAFVRTDPGTRENEWRRIRVAIRGSNLTVYAPEGYYAPW